MPRSSRWLGPMVLAALSVTAVLSACWLLGLHALACAGLTLTFWLVLLSARVYLLADDFRRVCLAIGASREDNENGQLLASLLLLGIYDSLSPEVRGRIPQRLYLWAVRVTAGQDDGSSQGQQPSAPDDAQGTEANP